MLVKFLRQTPQIAVCLSSRKLILHKKSTTLSPSYLCVPDSMYRIRNSGLMLRLLHRVEDRAVRARRKIKTEVLLSLLTSCVLPRLPETTTQRRDSRGWRPRRTHRTQHGLGRKRESRSDVRREGQRDRAAAHSQDIRGWLEKVIAMYEASHHPRRLSRPVFTCCS